MKKVKGNDEKQRKGGKKENPKPQKESTQKEEESAFDFGGLPRRDLKKNLGCG